MNKLKKKSTIGYTLLSIIGCLVIVLFINDSEALQTNCSNYTSPIDFNYTIETRNLSTSGSSVNTAICNITISPYINNSYMINESSGRYHCPIAVDFPTGRYSTNITCVNGNNEAQLLGNFEIVPDDVPLSIIAYLIGITILFVFYIFKLDEQYNPIKTFLFLITFLIYFVVLVLVFNIIDEEGAVGSLVNFSGTIYTVYTYIFSFVVFFVVVMFIINVVNLLRGKKMERKGEGTVFD